MDSVMVRRDFESVPLILRELADEALRGNICMAELRLRGAAEIYSLRKWRTRGWFAGASGSLEFGGLQSGSGVHYDPLHDHRAAPDIVDSIVVQRPITFGRIRAIPIPSTRGTKTSGNGKLRLRPAEISSQMGTGN